MSIGGRLFAVYHEVARHTEYANETYDGLLLVCADSPEEAYQMVSEQIGDHFNDCLIEEIIAHDPKIVLEFWRTPPKRVGRRCDREEVTTA